MIVPSWLVVKPAVLFASKALWIPFDLILEFAITPNLVKKLARAITDQIYDTNYKIERGSDPINLSRIGGQTQPISKSWANIYEERYTRRIWDISITFSERESLFFGYFGSLENWCELNLTGDFILWSDEEKVYLFLTHEYDRTYFALKWGGELPHWSDFNG